MRGELSLNQIIVVQLSWIEAVCTITPHMNLDWLIHQLLLTIFPFRREAHPPISWQLNRQTTFTLVLQ